MKFNEIDTARVSPYMNGSVLSQNDELPKKLPPLDNLQQNQGGENQKDTLTVGNFLSNPESFPSSRRSSSARWKSATDAVIVTNALIKLAADKQKQKIPNLSMHRKMDGTNAYIPVLPIWLAVILLTFNCIVPGLGTILSSFAFCCVGTTYDENERSQLKDKVIGIAMVNFLTGVAQLFTTSFLLVGWFWSISRGVTMVYLSIEADEAKKNRNPGNIDS